MVTATNKIEIEGNDNTEKINPELKMSFEVSFSNSWLNIKVDEERLMQKLLFETEEIKTIL